MSSKPPYNFKEFIIGDGSPRVAIIGAVHGDEPIGKLVIDHLKDVNLLKGTLSLIIAHPSALELGKRYIDNDLNRSFPGIEDDVTEKGLAFRLSQRLSKIDIVLDIHSTKAKISKFAIVTNLNEDTKKLLSMIPGETIILAQDNVFGGHELIANVSCGVSLEYRSKDHDKSLESVVEDIKAILTNLGMLSGEARKNSVKQIYTIDEAYRVPKGFIPLDSLRELEKISAGQLVGHVDGEEVAAKYSFYPLFLKKASYEDTLCLAAQNKKQIEV